MWIIPRLGRWAVSRLLWCLRVDVSANDLWGLGGLLLNDDWTRSLLLNDDWTRSWLRLSHHLARSVIVIGCVVRVTRRNDNASHVK